MEILRDRAVVEVAGKDKTSFLQGIITNDINLLESKKCLFSLILTPQGKFLYEVFLFLSEEGDLYMDCFSEKAEELIAYLSKYKLRADVEFLLNKKLKIYWSKDNHQHLCEYVDPRMTDVGYRGVIEQEEVMRDYNGYNEVLCELSIPNCHYDMNPEKSFPLEYGMDHLNAISFTKGCFIGQELTARMKHRMVVRKSLYKVVFDSADLKIEDPIIYHNGQKLGEIIAKEGKFAIAKLRDEEYEAAKQDSDSFSVDNHRVMIEIPKWKI